MNPIYEAEREERRSALRSDYDHDPEPYWHKETGMCGDRDDARGDY